MPLPSIDFALITIAGNITRYRIVRPLVEQAQDITSRWYPIRTWFESDPLRVLPSVLRIRLRHAIDSFGLFFSKPSDAVVIHAFETYPLYVLWALLTGRRQQAIIWNGDAGLEIKSERELKRTDLFVFWSKYALDGALETLPKLVAEKCRVLHPGLDLENWHFAPANAPADTWRLLFVGGDFMRKGGDVLLEAFEQGLSGTCELHVATQAAHLPGEFRARMEANPRVHLHLDLAPGSQELKDLFRTSHAFVMPTNQDSSSWVGIEAMATGLPVIISPQEGIRDIVLDGETGLYVEPKNSGAVIDAVRRLQSSPGLREQLIRNGRAHIERNYDARVNTRKFLDEIVAAVASRRASLSSRSAADKSVA